MTAPTPVWFITAASSGFGHDIALIALQRGHKVVATARDPARIRDLADAGADTRAFDVTAPLADIEALAAAVFAEHGRVDYLVNAAGYILTGAVEEATPEQTFQQFNTNVFGTINTIKAFLPGMRAQPLGADGARGTVVTFGSLGSWRGGAGFAAYAMTKACVSSLAESLRDELAPFKISATTVEPGYFRTGFLNASAQVLADEMEAYGGETPTGRTRSALKVTDGRQLGDVRKGSAVVVDVLTGSGVAKGKELPVRIVLGSDCDGFIRAQCRETVELLDAWRDVTVSTDHSE
ncbi:hypothetical protein B0J13DRAFT_567004 [Dactylonectria estremocensis]|uniref:Uncharacterized protein n=1 Tax=Dactylonectria estremocensis TaxID=1079267 RepID=A0A9P9IJW6_9HYPO|nr:hypothetical protein B0J13DRAFT_567004 [Dactylonectria estremocensis]